MPLPFAQRLDNVETSAIRELFKLLGKPGIISFAGGFFNIGGEGQLYVGALAGAWAGFTFKGLPGPALSLLVMLLGVLAAAIWGWIPGALLAAWKVDIVVSTLMMSSIGVLLTAYLVTGPLKDPSTTSLATPRIATSLDEGLDTVKRMLSKAAAQGAEIVCFPEAWLPGLRGLDFAVLPFDEAAQARVLQATSQWAKAYRIATILGMERLSPAGRQIAASVKWSPCAKSTAHHSSASSS